MERVYSIGLYVGRSPFDFESPENIDNPVLTREDVSDVQAISVADPFMLKVNRTWYMFFEIYERLTAKGKIGVATSENGTKWEYQQVVLDEPFHLSYPYVFQWENGYYMVPESCEINAVRLYKAVNFPTQWSHVGNLLNGCDYVDPSVFRFNDKWWLFTGHGMAPFRGDTLHLYYADELTGPWFEHPKSPVIRGDGHIDRPAGRVLIENDKVIRYAQDCYPRYGTLVRAFEVTDLTTTSYHERGLKEKNPILEGSGYGWNRSGMHHIDPHSMDDGRWVACVDGWFMGVVQNK